MNYFTTISKLNLSGNYNYESINRDVCFYDELLDAVLYDDQMEVLISEGHKYSTHTYNRTL